MTVGKVVFQDSTLHMCCSVEKMPGIYGFREVAGKKIQKGFCPYRWYESWDKVLLVAQDNNGKNLFGPGESPFCASTPPHPSFYPEHTQENPDLQKWWLECKSWDPMEVLAY